MLPERRSTQFSLSAHYFCFFGFIAVFMGFYPLLLDEQGHSASIVVLVSLVANVAIMFGASFSQTLAHWIGHPIGIGVGSAVLGVVAAVFLLGEEAALPVVLLNFLIFFFAKGSSTLVDAVAARVSFERGIRFERVRIWGSIGFVLVILGLGPLVDIWGAWIVLPVGILMLLPLIPFSYLLVPAGYEIPEEPEAVEPHPAHTRWRWNINCLLISAMLLWASHSVLQAYQSVYLEALDWSGTWIAISFAVGVFVEMAVFVGFSRIEKHLSLVTVYKISAVLAISRWLILGATTDPGWILFSQALHGFTFGAQYIAAVKLTYLLLPDELRNRGQGWLVTYSTSGGMLLGKLVLLGMVQGLISYTELQPVFLGCAVVALLGLLTFYFISRETRESLRDNQVT